MHNYDLTLPGNLRVRLSLPVDAFASQEAQLLLSAYVPGVSFARTGRPTLTIAFVESRNKSLRRRNGKTDLRDHWAGQGSLLDFIHLTYSEIRLRWLRKGLYCLHAACVGDERGHILLLGHSGSGKTSSALRMTADGMTIFSGNKTLVSIDSAGRLTAVAGTKTMTTKAEDSNKHLGHLGDTAAYGGRSAFPLPDRMYTAEPSVNISSVAIVRLNDGAESAEELSPLSALHRCYPFFLDVVNQDAIVAGGELVLPGTAPAGVQKKLARDLKLAFARTKAFAVTGTMAHVAATLKKNHE